MDQDHTITQTMTVRSPTPLTLHFSKATDSVVAVLVDDNDQDDHDDEPNYNHSKWESNVGELL